MQFCITTMILFHTYGMIFGSFNDIPLNLGTLTLTLTIVGGGGGAHPPIVKPLKRETISVY